MYSFEKKFVERFNQTRRTSDHLTVHTENGAIYNLKYRLDFNIPTIYVDVTHCLEGEVFKKERVYHGGQYR